MVKGEAVGTASKGQATDGMQNSLGDDTPFLQGKNKYVHANVVRGSAAGLGQSLYSNEAAANYGQEGATVSKKDASAQSHDAQPGPVGGMTVIVDSARRKASLGNFARDYGASYK